MKMCITMYKWKPSLAIFSLNEMCFNAYHTKIVGFFLKTSLCKQFDQTLYLCVKTRVLLPIWRFTV